MGQRIVKPHWSLRGGTPVKGTEVEVYYHGTLKQYHDKVVDSKGRYEPAETSRSLYINLTRSWPEAITYCVVRNEQFRNENTPMLLVISPEKVKKVLVPNTGRRLYAYHLEPEMYKVLDVKFSEIGAFGQPAVSREWKKRLE